MNNNIKLLLFISSILPGLCLFTQAQGPVEKISEENDISIYKKEKENSRNYIVVFDVNATPGEAENLLLYPKAYKSFVNNIIDVKELNEINDSLQYFWVLIGVKNILTREGVIRTTRSMKGSNSIIINQKLDKKHPYNDDFKKIRKFDTRWKINRKDRRKIVVELNYTGGKDENSRFVNRILDKILVNKLQTIAEKVRNTLEMEASIY